MLPQTATKNWQTEIDINSTVCYIAVFDSVLLVFREYSVGGWDLGLVYALVKKSRLEIFFNVP